MEIQSAPRTRKNSGYWDGFRMIVMSVLAIIFSATYGNASPLEFCGLASVSFEAIFSHIDGRMGFDQQLDGTGTLNDLKQDLGLPGDNKTFRLEAKVRPLEHHLLRMYGTIPEFYKGSTTTQRELRTRNTVYPAGTLMHSDLRTAQFGFGYDLDFLLGPRWMAGFNGDFRYIDIKTTMKDAQSGLEDTITIDEMIPCLGAHMQFRLPLGMSIGSPSLNAGGYSRLTYGITPNYFNYVDLKMGVVLGTRPNPWVSLDVKVAYEHESYFHNQEQISSRIFEYKRDGILFSLEATF